MEEQNPVISQRTLSTKKDIDDKISDAYRGDLSQRSETISIPDVILESLKSDLSSSIPKLADADVSEMTLGNAARPLSDVTNLSDSGGSKEDARRSWTNLSHLSNFSSALGPRDHSRSKSWDPKEVRLHHLKSVELMKLLEDDDQPAPQPNERVGNRTGLKYSSITTLNSIDDFEPRFCTTKTINLGASEGITIEIKNPVKPTPVERMESLRVYKGYQRRRNEQPSSVSVRVGNKENTTRTEDTRRAVPSARISLKEPDIKIAPVKQTDKTVCEVAATLMPERKVGAATSVVERDFAYESKIVTGKNEHAYWTPVQKRRASDVLLKRGFERQSFDSRVSYFPVAKPRMSLLKPVVSPDPIYSNREELNQKISLSRILQSVNSPTPSEEKDLTPPWRKPSIASTVSSSASRRQSLAVEESSRSRSVSRNSLDVDVVIGSENSKPSTKRITHIPTIQAESDLSAKSLINNSFESSFVQKVDLSETVAKVIDISPTQTLKISRCNTPERYSSLKKLEPSEKPVTKTISSSVSSDDVKTREVPPTSLQVTTKSTIRIVWPPAESEENNTEQEVKPVRRRSLRKENRQTIGSLNSNKNDIENLEDKRGATTVELTQQEPSGLLQRNVQHLATEKAQLRQDSSLTAAKPIQELTNSIFIPDDSKPLRPGTNVESADDKFKVVPPPRKKKVAFKLSNPIDSPVAAKAQETPATSVKAVHFGDMSGDFLWANKISNKEEAQTTSVSLSTSEERSSLSAVALSSAAEVVQSALDVSVHDFDKTKSAPRAVSPKHSLKLIDGIDGASPLLKERFRTSSEFFRRGGQLKTSDVFQPETETAKKLTSLVATFQKQDEEVSALLPKPAQRTSRASKRTSMILSRSEAFQGEEKDIRKMTSEDTSSQFTIVDTSGFTPKGNSRELKSDDNPCSSQYPATEDNPARLLSLTPEPANVTSVLKEELQPEKSNTVPITARNKSRHGAKKELPKFILTATATDPSSSKDSSESTGTDVSEAFREILLHRKGQKVTSLPDDSIYISPSLNSFCSNDQLPASEPTYSVYESSKVSHFFNRRDDQNTYEAVTKANSPKVPRHRENNHSVPKKSPSYVKRMSSHYHFPATSGGCEVKIYQHPTKKASMTGSTFERSKSLEHHKAHQEDHEFKLRSLPKDNSAFEKRFARSLSKSEEHGKIRGEKLLYSSPSSAQRKGSMERRSERFRRSLQADYASSASTSVEKEKTIEDIVKVDGNDLTTSLETLIALNKNETDCDDRRSSACSAITVRENKPPKHYLSFVSVMSRPKAKARRKLFNKEDKIRLVERLSQGSSADGWSETSSIIHTSFAAGDCRSDRQSSVFEYTTSKGYKGSVPVLPVAPPRRKQRKPFLPSKVFKPRNGLRSYRSSTSLNKSERSNSLRGSQSYSDLKMVSKEEDVLDSKVHGSKMTLVPTESCTTITAGTSTPSLVCASDDFLKSLQQLAGALETCNKKWGLEGGADK